MMVVLLEAQQKCLQGTGNGILLLSTGKAEERECGAWDTVLTGRLRSSPGLTTSERMASDDGVEWWA